MKYDGMITIATGNSRRSTSWKNKEMLWSDFVDKLSHVTRTQETQAEYARMPKDERDNAKDVGGFVGGTLKGGRRKIDAITQRRLITLDMDSIAVDEDPWPASIFMRLLILSIFIHIIFAFIAYIFKAYASIKNL